MATSQLAVGGNNSRGNGTGGSVYITSGTIAGTGNINANCGSGSYNGGGGGGRVAVILTTSADFTGYTGTTTAFCGQTAGTKNGAAGTFYLEEADAAG